MRQCRSLPPTRTMMMFVLAKHHRDEFHGAWKCKIIEILWENICQSDSKSYRVSLAIIKHVQDQDSAAIQTFKKIAAPRV